MEAEWILPRHMCKQWALLGRGVATQTRARKQTKWDVGRGAQGTGSRSLPGKAPVMGLGWSLSEAQAHHVRSLASMSRGPTAGWWPQPDIL